MRDITTKADGSSNLTAAEFNSFMVELENAVTASGQALDAAAGPDTDSQQLPRSILLHALAGASYQDSGVANTHVLAAVQSNFQQPTAYFDGMVVRFKAAATNTGACTINVAGLGAISFTQAGGAAFTAGLIGAGNIITAQFFSGDNRFEEVSNTTPELSGPAAPDQIAIYSDAGSVSANILTIEAGYIQPSAFTDQMAVLFRANASNNGVGNHSIQITGLGTRDVVEADGSDPIANRMPAGAWVMAVFREVRNAFEIAFVYEAPTSDTVLATVVTSSSGTLYNLSTLADASSPTSYIDGQVVIFRAPQANTGSVDINVDGIGQRDLRNFDGTNFASGVIQSNAVVIAQYILSEDRFRAFVSQEFPTLRSLDEARSIRYERVANSPVTNVGAPVLQWDNIAHDDLGFDQSGSPTIPAGQGIERVDITVGINPSLSPGENVSLEIQLNGNPIAGTVTFQGAGSNFMSATAMDVPVSDGDQIRVVADVGASGARNLNGGSLTVRVSKFAS